MQITRDDVLIVLEAHGLAYDGGSVSVDEGVKIVEERRHVIEKAAALFGGTTKSFVLENVEFVLRHAGYIKTDPKFTTV